MRKYSACGTELKRKGYTEICFYVLNSVKQQNILVIYVKRPKA